MRIDRDTIEEIVKTITQNKSRSLLTAFGVFWGILILVILLSGSNGVRNSLLSQFQGFATNSGFTYSGSTSIPYKGFKKGRYWNITTDDLKNIRANVPELDHVSAASSHWGTPPIYEDKKHSDGWLQGVDPDYQYIEDPNLIYGRSINEIDNRECRKVCVLGKAVYESLFEKGSDPCGKRVQVDGVYYTVVGVSDKQENINILGMNRDAVSIPLSTLQKTYNEGKVVYYLAYTAKPGCTISEIEPKIRKIVGEYHYVSPDDKEGICQVNAEEIFEMTDALFTGLEVLIWLVGMGTLLAGIIGVSNIMMVTVKERTVEIGIRRAIGAQPKDILQQIMAESILLTSVAGMTGITFGVFVMNIIDSQIVDDMGNTFGYMATFGSVVGLTLVVILLGAVAGLAPAMRAMAIRPVEAMHED
ncbi:MAG: ABC transporter permease [Bacteroidia bacterium]|nr:ABC transporter permease [Bacteroidia bacterium]